MGVPRALWDIVAGLADPTLDDSSRYRTGLLWLARIMVKCKRLPNNSPAMVLYFLPKSQAPQE